MRDLGSTIVVRDLVARLPLDSRSVFLRYKIWQKEIGARLSPL